MPAACKKRSCPRTFFLQHGASIQGTCPASQIR